MSGLGPGGTAWKLSFQLSPIILTGGIAQNVPGGMLPIISITEALNFTLGLLSGANDLDLDNFFANFEPLPGSRLASNQYGKYPFANQAVAANAVIQQPLTISLLMRIPVRQPLGYAAKLATMSALQQAITQHTQSGGTFTVATPSYIYTNCLLDDLRDVSSGQSKQPQTAFQWDFEQPLITLAQAQQAQNSMMSKISSGVQTDGSLSGLSPTIGSPSTLATPSISPAASGPAGAGVASTSGAAAP
jgi:hypothetical protein